MYELELDALTHGDLQRFADWPDLDVPLVAAGVYSIWNRRGQFVYVGMSGRFTEQAMTAKRLANKPAGLRTRLGSHASGRRSGDQFCIYVCDRLVLPTLDTEQIAAVSRGELSLDRLTRDYIHTELAYRYVVVDLSATAFAIEHLSAVEGLAGMRPLLNPRPPQTTVTPNPASDDGYTLGSGPMEMYPEWVYYPSSTPPPPWVNDFVSVIVTARTQIDSVAVVGLTSDAVLAHLRPGLVDLGYSVEAGKQKAQKIRRPVLFGDRGTERVAYEIDAIHDELGVVVEVEAGRGARGNAVYRDLIRTSLIVGAEYLALGVMGSYRHMSGGREVNVESYRDAKNLLDAVYASGRLGLPFQGLLLFGY